MKNNNVRKLSRKTFRKLKVSFPHDTLSHLYDHIRHNVDKPNKYITLVKLLRGKWNTRRNPHLRGTIFPPQTLHYLAWGQAKASEVKGRLTSE